MSIVKNIGLVVVVLGLVIGGVGMVLPTQFKVERSVEIQTAPEVIHEYVADLEKWPLWAPWQKADPTLVITLGDITSGVGASQSWIGDSGSGSLNIVKSSPQSGIAYDLYFDSDTHKNDCELRYETVASAVTQSLGSPASTTDSGSESTKVTWRMSGEMQIPVVGGYLALIMDKLAGDMFNQGLSELKKVVEA